MNKNKDVNNDEKLALKAKAKEEKLVRKNKLKEQEKEKEIQQKVLSKEQDRVYKEMMEYEKNHKKEEKIAPEDSYISLQHINKIYSNRVQAVFDFNLEIKKNEFIVFVGPSGCGKSTTLRMIAGLEDITSGDLYIDGVYANDLEPKDRDVSMVFQSYALYPHMTVYNNMAFGLKMRHIPSEEVDERVHKAAKILEIEEYLDRKPRALSGGQCQRVALGRAIVRNAKVFLMDEPLSNLDAKLRVQMRSEIVKLHEELGATTIYVTHDQTEAMTMATRIVVLKKGYVQQIGTPKEIYQHPNNTFVATFIGSPAMNIIEGRFDGKTITLQNGFVIDCGAKKLDKIHSFYKNEIKKLSKKNKMLEEKILEIKSTLKNDDKNEYHLQYEELEKNNKFISVYENNIKNNEFDVFFGVRPEDIYQKGFKNNVNIESDYFDTNIDVAELLGNEYYIHTFIGKEKIIAKVNAGQDIKHNEIISIAFDLEKIHIFDKVSTKYIW